LCEFVIYADVWFLMMAVKRMGTTRLEPNWALSQIGYTIQLERGGVVA